MPCRRGQQAAHEREHVLSHAGFSALDDRSGEADFHWAPSSSNWSSEVRRRTLRTFGWGLEKMISTGRSRAHFLIRSIRAAPELSMKRNRLRSTMTSVALWAANARM